MTPNTQNLMISACIIWVVQAVSEAKQHSKHTPILQFLNIVKPLCAFKVMRIQTAYQVRHFLSLPQHFPPLYFLFLHFLLRLEYWYVKPFSVWFPVLDLQEEEQRDEWNFTKQEATSVY